MPTNEERRAIASAMREEAQKWDRVNPEGWFYSVYYIDTILQDLVRFAGIDGSVKTSELFSRFADLIEPEQVCIANVTFTDEQVEKIKADVLKELEQPERTCEFDSQACGKRRCKRCGALVSVDSVWDCSGCIPAKYCPNCGAKAVGE